MRYIAEFTLIYVIEAVSAQEATALAFQIPIEPEFDSNIESDLLLRGRVEPDKRTGQLTALYVETEQE